MLLVVGHGAEVVRGLAPDGAVVVESPRWADGISQSLGAALDALESDASVTGVCVGLADQPRVGAEAYRRVAEAGAGGATIAVATYSGVRGNPVWLARSVWPEARVARPATPAPGS